MKILTTSALTTMMALGLVSEALAQGQTPPAGGAGGPPAGFNQAGLAPMLALTLVPDMAATIDIDVPGGLQGPQGSLKTEYSGQAEPEGTSPPLTWTEGPAGTQSYAIVLQDMSANRDTNSFLHWALVNLPSGTTSLPAGIPEGEEVAGVDGALQLQNGAGNPIYLPPGPPGSQAAVTPVGGEDEISLYTFQLFALDTVLDIAADAALADLTTAMEGHVLAYGIEHATLQRGAGGFAGGPPPEGGAPGGAPPGGAPGGAPPEGGAPGGAAPAGAPGGAPPGG